MGIEDKDRHQLRDELLSIQDKINYHFRSARRSFDLAMKYDRKKEAIEKRLAELEDYPSQSPKTQTFPPDLS